MGARAVSLVFLSSLFAALSTHPALAEPPTVLYRLGGEQAFQEGCFGQCLCPVLAAEMQGTFGLTAAGPSGGFQTWTVSDVDWLVPELGIRLTGSGLFWLSPPPGSQQQLILDLSLDGGPIEQYDSGLVPAAVPFPKIEAMVSLDWSQPRDDLRERLTVLGEI